MSKRAVVPPKSFAAKGYSHGIVLEARRLLVVSGQVALDAERRLVGPGDLRAQTEQALRNLANVLEAAGGSPADVVKLNLYVVDYRSEQLPMIQECLARVFPGEVPPAGTLVGVTALGREEWLVEIEAIAALE